MVTNQKKNREIESGRSNDLLKSFLADEQGQATTEYVILIMVLVGIILALGKALGSKIKALFQSKIGNLGSGFFDVNKMHKFRL